MTARITATPRRRNFVSKARLRKLISQYRVVEEVLLCKQESTNSAEEHAARHVHICFVNNVIEDLTDLLGS